MTGTPKQAISARAASPAPEFDWLVPGKQWFHLKEVAALIGMSETFVKSLLDTGDLAAHEWNAAGGERMSKRIPRAFVVSLLVKSARYDAETKLTAFLSCLREFTPDQLRAISLRASQMAMKGKGI